MSKNHGSPRLWIDGHLDLAYIAQHGVDLSRPAQPGDVHCVSMPALRSGRVRVCVATIFIEKGPEGAGTPWGYDPDAPGSAAAAAMRQMDWYEAMERSGTLRIVRSREDLDAALEAGPDAPPHAVILMEGADAIESPEDAARWHARGVRIVGLTWALGSRWCGGNSTGGGLAPGAERLIAALDDLGIVHDASHLSDESFDGLMAATSRTVIASHSNARALLRSPAPPARPDRHLTDRQMRLIAGRGGIIGLNLYGRFLASGRPATMADAIAHVSHVASMAGRACCALGSDLDGGFGPDQVPVGLRGPDQYDTLDHALALERWTQDQRESFAWGAWARVLRQALPSTRR